MTKTEKENALSPSPLFVAGTAAELLERLESEGSSSRQASSDCYVTAAEMFRARIARSKENTITMTMKTTSTESSCGYSFR